jgi:hypothetical protein
MFVLTLDQRGSTGTSDRVPALLAQLAAGPRAVLPFERTAGDEIQGLFSSASAALEAVSLVLRAGGFAVGLGVGDVETPLPSSTREARGPAYTAARSAVEQAKGREGVPFAVVAHGPKGTRDADPQGDALDAVAWPWAVLLSRRTPRQWDALDAVMAHETQKAAAESMGLSPQAVSRLVRSAFRDELAACAVSLSGALERLDAALRKGF